MIRSAAAGVRRLWMTANQKSRSDRALWKQDPEHDALSLFRLMYHPRTLTSTSTSTTTFRNSNAPPKSPQSTHSKLASSNHRFKHVDNPGMRMDHFRELFQPVNPTRRKVYPRRWDWHLRMFLYSLAPGGMLYLFTCLVDMGMRRDKVFQAIMEESRQEMKRRSEMGTASERADLDDKQQAQVVKRNDNLYVRWEKRLAEIEGQFQVLKEKLEEQQKLADDLASRVKDRAPDDVLSAAHRISRTMVRPRPKEE